MSKLFWNPFPHLRLKLYFRNLEIWCHSKQDDEGGGGDGGGGASADDDDDDDDDDGDDDDDDDDDARSELTHCKTRRRRGAAELRRHQ